MIHSSPLSFLPFLQPTHDITPSVPAMAVSTAINTLRISFQFSFTMIRFMISDLFTFIADFVILSNAKNPAQGLC